MYIFSRLKQWLMWLNIFIGLAILTCFYQFNTDLEIPRSIFSRTCIFSLKEFFNSIQPEYTHQSLISIWLVFCICSAGVRRESEDRRSRCFFSPRRGKGRKDENLIFEKKRGSGSRISKKLQNLRAPDVQHCWTKCTIARHEKFG